MNKNIVYVIVAVVLLVAIVFIINPNILGKKDSGLEEKKITSEQKEEKVLYTCPMHPSVISDHPGACPICGMTLVKKISQKELSGSDEIAMLKSVSLSSTQRVMANISTTSVVRQTINREINATGVIDFAEPLQTKISARFRGRIDKLFANFTGEVVKAGQPLFELYSPDLVSAEQEFLLTLNSQSDIGEALYSSESEQRLIQASKDRLRLTYGMTEAQINSIDSTRQVKPAITFYAPISGTVITKNIQEGEYVDEGTTLYQLANLSKVWAYLDIYEKDIQHLSVNQIVHITNESFPGEMFTGHVTFIDPVLNPNTRTIRVRTEFVNTESKLKPQMWVKAHIVLPAKSALVVPTTAILPTGKRNLVWVEVKENSFEPREVMLGIENENFVEVLSGLKESESVVTTGGYLLDSESQLQAPRK